MKFKEIVSNPIRMRIVQYMGVHKESTTKEIAAYMPDVPRRTLYRHINYLVDVNALKVKETRQVRGGIERVLIDNQGEHLIQMDPSDAAYQLFTYLYNQFARYHEQHEVNICDAYDKDLIGTGTYMIMLDDDETRNLLDEFGKVIQQYEKKHKKKYGDKDVGKYRSITYISAPVDQENT